MGNDARNVTEKTTYSKACVLHDFSEITALVFLNISEFLDTIDILYISRFFVIRRCKPRKTANIGTQMHPRAPKGPLGAPWGSHGAHQMPQDRLLAPIWYPNGHKMTQNDPQMIPTSGKIAKPNPNPQK